MAQSSRPEKPVSADGRHVDYIKNSTFQIKSLQYPLLIIFYTKLWKQSQVLFFETLKESSSDFHGLRGSPFGLTLAY